MIVMTEDGVEVAFRGAVRLAELAPELVDRIFEKLLPDRRAEIDDRTDRPEIIAGDVRPRDQKLDRRRHQRDDRWPVPPQRSDQYFWIESGKDRYRRAVIERREDLEFRAGSLSNLSHRIGDLGAGKYDRRPRVVENGDQFGRRQTPVERRERAADLRRGEPDLEDLDRVLADIADRIAALDTHFQQAIGDRVGPLIP